MCSGNMGVEGVSGVRVPGRANINSGLSVNFEFGVTVTTVLRTYLETCAGCWTDSSVGKVLAG